VHNSYGSARVDNDLLKGTQSAPTTTGAGTSGSIKKIETSDQNDLIEKAKIAAATELLFSSRRLRDYGIRDQAALIEIAKTAAARDGKDTSKFIKNYGITDQAALIEIAKIAAAKDARGTSQFIRNYGIKDQAALIEIAKIAATDPFRSDISVHIRKYRIKDQAALIEIAKIAAETSPYYTSRDIRNYGIKDESALIEIAKIAATVHGGFTSRYIRNYRIKDQAALIEIANIVASSSRVGACEYIRNYRIKDQAALIEIAKIDAIKHPYFASRFFRNYRIKDQEAVIEIAKITAAHDVDSTTAHIRNYGIKDQAALIEIAKIASAKGTWCRYSPAELIRNYGIKDQEALIEIAKVDATKHPYTTSKFFRNYGIKDQAAVIEIAMIAAADDGGGTSAHIQNYEIKDQAVLIEIAKIAAAKNSRDTSQFIRNYGITDQATLIKIAKIAVARDGAGTSEFIRNYGIKDQKDLVEIAKIAAANDGHGTSKFIQNYGITDQATLIEIAKIAAARDGAGTSKFIGSYGITDQASLIEIAKLAANQDGFRLSEHIYWFFIADQSALIEIARIALGNNFESIQHISNYRLPKHVLSSQVLTPILTAKVYAEEFRGSLLRIFKKASQNGEGLTNTPADWSTREPKEKANYLAEWFSALYKEHTGREIDVASTLEVQSEDVVYDALAGTIAYWDHVDVERFGSRARATLATLSGYDSIPAGSLSPNACRELWGVLVTARETLGKDLATRIPVNFSANKAQALRIVTLATALKGLGGELPTFNEQIDTTEKFQVAEKILTERVTEAFRTCLSIGAADDTRAVVKLWERWGGDLTPFAVLAGRYRSNAHWNRELPVLSEIAKRCLDDSFHQWRYRREDQQLSMLSDEQLHGWRNNPCLISPITAATHDKESAAASQLANIKNIFTTNLLLHVPQEIAESVRMAPLTGEEAENLLGLSDRNFSKRTLEEGIKLIAYSLESNDKEKIRKAMTLINGAKVKFLESLPEEKRKQVADDLKSLHAATKGAQVAEGAEYCVISVVTDDPKLLLMTGDLVQAASCQNYRNGSHIFTLPGYVVDGNIKLALSYVVKKGVLDNMGVKDYSNLVFDPATQSLSVRGEDKRLPLGYAMRREVLRVGAAGEDAVCLIERPYLQPHGIGAQIEQHQREVVAAHLKASGIRLARKGEEVHCPPSRNPGGVYSDMGGGAKSGAYTVTATNQS
jgi:hypothetical protein